MSETKMEANDPILSQSCGASAGLREPLTNELINENEPPLTAAETMNPDRETLDASIMCSSYENSKKKSKASNRGNIQNQRTKMRPPQQPGLPRNICGRPFKPHLKNGKSSGIADMENNCNAKNQPSYRKQHASKNMKQNFQKLIRNRAAAQFALRSKFFLPAKRPRKEVIIPPTKFLLGGNISDPLNLNGLQDESLNTTPNQTPQQSPITTPPKVEVIIPPNIYDPLHLLDPVDSIEYEKQLVSPMKRKSKSKHRNRKKKPKRKKSKNSNLDNTSTPAVEPLTAVNAVTDIDQSDNADDNVPARIVDIEQRNKLEGNVCGMDGQVAGQSGSIYEGIFPKDNNNECPWYPTVSKIDGEKPSRDLRLDLSDLSGGSVDITCGGGRKRRISEGPNKNNKFRRTDSMDKIVSPVIPQPGAWKRPPRTVPTGARKVSRLRSTSVSENELASPTGETIALDTLEVQSSALTALVVNNQKDSEGVTTQVTRQPKQHASKVPKFKPEAARYQYGNFDRYTGYRNINEIMDVRLQVFHRHAHLFRGKDILDIGCNAGHITVAVAKDLAPKSIVGIDIDTNLIMRAKRNLSLNVMIPKCETVTSVIGTKRKHNGSQANEIKSLDSEDEPKADTDVKSLPVESETDVGKNKRIMESNIDSAQRKKDLNSKRRPYQKMKEREKNEFFPISFAITYGGIPEIDCVKKDNFSPQQPSEGHAKFPMNISFRVANYVLKDEAQINNEPQQYDVILCLSVTKWIQLNFGDAGLKLAFKRMFNQLRPGGKLILEAQNWASYKKKKNLTETIYNNYKNIEFFPNKFHEYLLGNEVGFSHSYCLGAPRHMNKGFSRPIQLYAKGDYTPNHVRWSDNYHPQTPHEAYRGIYAEMVRPRYPTFETPRGNSGSYSCRQTPGHPNMATSQYYNPLESDSYLPSYDTEIQNRHYVFASPLYQTVWSPPASLRNSSANKTPVFGSIREADVDEGSFSRHVYPPNDCGSSPLASGSAFNSVREPDSDDQQGPTISRHVYANCDGSPSPMAENLSSPRAPNSTFPPGHRDNQHMVIQTDLVDEIVTENDVMVGNESIEN